MSNNYFYTMLIQMIFQNQFFYPIWEYFLQRNFNNKKTPNAIQRQAFFFYSNKVLIFYFQAVKSALPGLVTMISVRRLWSLLRLSLWFSPCAIIEIRLACTPCEDK